MIARLVNYLIAFTYIVMMSLSFMRVYYLVSDSHTCSSDPICSIIVDAYKDMLINQCGDIDAYLWYNSETYMVAFTQ